MACPSCRTTLNLIPKGTPTAAISLRRLSSQCGRPMPSPPRSQSRTPRRRTLHTTPSPCFSLREIIGKRIASMAGSQSPYFIYTSTERLYKVCASQADYEIPAGSRKNGTLKLTEEGEEIGVSKNPNPWHDEFGLLPTFSTWAHVTMLHLYLLVVRLRNTEKSHQTAWQEQLVNHFFYQAEQKMEDVHELHSRVIRQTYLKDLFVQWRGLILSCDEGMVKGDAVLAAAVWRNLFKANEDVDLRSLAAVVSWIRGGVKSLDALPDELVDDRGELVFRSPVSAEFKGVDVPAVVMRDEFQKEGLVKP